MDLPNLAILEVPGKCLDQIISSDCPPNYLRPYKGNHDTTGSYHQVKDGYYMYVFDKPVSASSVKEEHFEMVSDHVIKPGECKREENNCIPQLRANMLAVAGGLAHCAITQNFNKITIHGIGCYYDKRDASYYRMTLDFKEKSSQFYKYDERVQIDQLIPQVVHMIKPSLSS